MFVMCLYACICCTCTRTGDLGFVLAVGFEQTLPRPSRLLSHDWPTEHGSLSSNRAPTCWLEPTLFPWKSEVYISLNLRCKKRDAAHIVVSAHSLGETSHIMFDNHVVTRRDKA